MQRFAMLNRVVRIVTIGLQRVKCLDVYSIYQHDVEEMNFRCKLSSVEDINVLSQSWPHCIETNCFLCFVKYWLYREMFQMKVLHLNEPCIPILCHRKMLYTLNLL
jgi:hypothetical protein